jgi:uncharacterized repeat protein (TIGR03803 family)
MPYVSSRCLQARRWVIVLALLIGAPAVYGADTYNIATRQLTIPSIVIGYATYSDMVVTVGTIVSGPSGNTALGSVDTYNPGNNQLTVQTVTVGAATFHNVVITVSGLLSIGTVSGADTYNGGDQAISLGQTGNTIYGNVHITVGSVVSVAGGMPTFGPDTYDSISHLLAIPAVQVGSRIYTNVVISLGRLESVGGVFSTIDDLNLYSFTGGIYGISNSKDGDSPVAGLIQGKDGNLYGTTLSGGQNDVGSVFKSTSSGAESVLYSFSGHGAVSNSQDGADPKSCLILASDNNFYGTSQLGGQNDMGTVYMISASGAEQVLYSFQGYPGGAATIDGSEPASCLVQGSDGNFYGTTPDGGAFQQGTVFKVTPAGVETVLHSFSGLSGTDTIDGSEPQAGLVVGSDGNFYGTTANGGAGNEGAVFKITPAGVETLVYSFSASTASGEQPFAGLIIGSDGNFYGTARYGGAYLGGAVFRLSPAGVATLLHSFSGQNNVSGSTDGAYPVASLVEASDGNFYGTTSGGGANLYDGTLFKITPTGVETVLHSFSGNHVVGSLDGFEPLAGMIQGSDGNLYGTAEQGGVYKAGVIFRLTGIVPAQ